MCVHEVCLHVFAFVCMIVRALSCAFFFIFVRLCVVYCVCACVRVRICVGVCVRV